METTLLTVVLYCQAIIHSTYAKQTLKVRYFSRVAQNELTKANYDHLVIYFDMFCCFVVIFVLVQSLVAPLFHSKVSLLKKQLYAPHTYWCTLRTPLAISRCTLRTPLMKPKQRKNLNAACLISKK